MTSLLKTPRYQRPAVSGTGAGIGGDNDHLAVRAGVDAVVVENPAGPAMVGPLRATRSTLPLRLKSWKATATALVVTSYWK